MKTLKHLLLILLIASPLSILAQSPFDAFEGEDDVTSVIVTKNMFKLLSNLDLESNDPEAKEYLELINNLDNVKVFTTENQAVAEKMNTAVDRYLNSAKGLSQLMRVKEEGNLIRFYAKEGKNENFVSELLMHLNGSEGDKKMTVIMSITGNIDLKKISKLTKDLDVPGSEKLKDLEKQKS